MNVCEFTEEFKNFDCVLIDTVAVHMHESRFAQSVLRNLFLVPVCVARHVGMKYGPNSQI
jgi:hypothetical protein